MASRKPFHLLLLLLLLRSVAGDDEVYDCAAPEDFEVPDVVDDDVDPFELRDYIVHVEAPPLSEFDELNQWTDFYKSLVTDTMSSNLFLSSLAAVPGGAAHIPAPASASTRVTNTYRHVMTGFAAKLSKTEVEAMSSMSWFVHAFPDSVYRPVTTYTPQLLGLRDGARGRGIWNTSNMGEGMIIGLLDTGVAPEHVSFNDEGMPPPPAKWKGRCDFAPGLCNNKLIGARSFINSTVIINNRNPPYDDDGHGTHTASTAVGSFVKNASVFGLAKGVAAGVAPRAHFAMYQVCKDTCNGKDIIAGMDAAVADGVDVISMSVASFLPLRFHSDSISAPSFAAMEKGIPVSAAASNDGPFPSTVKNDAPWVLTVAAGTTDRTFKVTVKLGNGQEFDGESLYQPGNFTTAMVPLVFPGDITGNVSVAKCVVGSLGAVDVKGKIVLCEAGLSDLVEKGDVVKEAGGVAMILMNNEHRKNGIFANMHDLPASYVTFADGSKIKAYINSTQSPVATMRFKGTVFQRAPGSPAIPTFSSRGPSVNARCIMKPDITGPGVDILAAWPYQADGWPSRAGVPLADFNIISGTSMSCPHLSGIVTIIKKAHPDWSPAMIKSAILTTAYSTGRNGQPIIDYNGQQADHFAMGAGHVNPRRAMEPGIVYDITADEYVSFLCGLKNYTDAYVRAITRRPGFSCSTVKSIPQAELNYPSIIVELPANRSSRITVRRTATNVGRASSTYLPHVEAPEGVAVSIDPPRLEFTSKMEKKSYTVTLLSTGGATGYVKGKLMWVSMKRVAMSPIVVRFV